VICYDRNFFIPGCWAFAGRALPSATTVLHYLPNSFLRQYHTHTQHTYHTIGELLGHTSHRSFPPAYHTKSYPLPPGRLHNTLSPTSTCQTQTIPSLSPQSSIRNKQLTYPPSSQCIHGIGCPVEVAKYQVVVVTSSRTRWCRTMGAGGGI